MGLKEILQEAPEERRARADRIAETLDPIMTAIGVLFLLVVLSERAVRDSSTLSLAFEVVSYVIWAIFVADFVIRVVIAPDTKAYLVRNWWQIPMLILPFLRFLRLVRLLRMGRAGRVLSSALRASRSAGAKFRSRIAWIASVHAIVVLSAANLLADLDRTSFANALHRGALAATTGEPIPGSAGAVALLEVTLALYSVAFFAGITGSLGAWYVEKGRTPAADGVPSS